RPSTATVAPNRLVSPRRSMVDVISASSSPFERSRRKGAVLRRGHGGGFPAPAPTPTDIAGGVRCRAPASTTCGIELAPWAGHDPRTRGTRREEPSMAGTKANATKTAAPTPTPGEVARAVFDAIAARDLDRVVPYLHDDVVDDFVAVGTFRGPAEIRGFFEEI